MCVSRHSFPDCWANMRCKAVMIGWKFSYGWRCLPVKVLLFHWFTEVNFTVTESSGVKFGRELNYEIGGGRSSIDRTGHKPGIKWNTHSPQAKTMCSLLKDHVSWCYSYKINVIYTGKTSATSCLVLRVLPLFQKMVTFPCLCFYFLSISCSAQVSWKCFQKLRMD